MNDLTEARRLGVDAEDVVVPENPFVYDIDDMNNAFDEGRRTGLAEALRMVEKHGFYLNEELASLAFGGR